MSTEGTYWCVVCGRQIIGEPRPDGSYLFVHDDIDHPETMTFDEETRPQ